jgi:HTH-type transcriptional regulator/antitoxin HipB
MDYPIQSPGQLSAHLRSLRKSRGLNQVQLGAVLGVGQTRIARIERDPTAVSVEQFLALLGALGIQMALRPNGPGSASDASADASNGALTKTALTRRHRLGEPW